MKFKVYYEKNGHQDWFISEGETVEDIQAMAHGKLDQINPDDFWAEEIQ